MRRPWESMREEREALKGRENLEQQGDKEVEGQRE